MLDEGGGRAVGIELGHGHDRCGALLGGLDASQERRIGAPLFERTSRTVALTPIGRRLREDLQFAPLNAHVTRYYTHPGITYLPIHDAPLTQWALAWPTTASNNAHLRAFLHTARDLGPHPIANHAL